MLVLSRRENQKVVFPNLGISVAVVAVQGKRVKLGFEAPSDVEILREELEPKRSGRAVSQRTTIDRHTIRNRLNAVVLTLHLLAQHGDMDSEDANVAISKALWELDELDQQLQGPVRVSAPPARRTLASHQRRALVVEDNENERGLLAAYLRARGYEVVEAEDGVAAIEYLERNEHPDVVLLDMNMPKLNGAKTVSRIRHTPELRQLTVFGVSGTERSQWQVPLGERGIDKWFQKPVNPESILHELDALACA